MNNKPKRPPRPMPTTFPCPVLGGCSKCTWKCQIGIGNDAFVAAHYNEIKATLEAAYREGTLNAQFP